MASSADRETVTWTAPDAATSPRTSAGPPPGAPSPPLAVPRLAPTTVVGLLDGAVHLLKARPAAVLTVVAVFVVPVQVFAAWGQRDLLGGGLDSLLNDPSTLSVASDAGGSGGVADVVGAIGPSLLLPFVAGALALLLAARYTGTDPSAGTLLRGVGRRWWALLSSWLLVHVLELAAGVALVLPGVAVMALFVVTAPVIAVEGVGPLAGMRRSWRLVARRFWPVLGLALLSALVATLVGQAVSLVPSVATVLVGVEVGWILVALAGTAASLVTVPLVAGATALCYLDLRVRTEGLDLELRAVETLDRVAS